jgi:hypothetical protein
MKIQFLAISILVLFALSCKKKKEKEESNFKEYTIDISIEETDTTLFEKSILIDLSSNEILVNNFSAIIGYKISEIKFKIKDYNGNENAKGNFEIAFTGVENSLKYNEIDLKEFSDQDAFFLVNFPQSSVNAAQDIMNTQHKISLTVNGLISEKPASFTIAFYVTIIIRSK